MSTATIAPLGGDAAAREATARAYLETLVDLYRRGMREPLPMYCKTTAAWANASYRGQPGDKAAEKAWATAYGSTYPREDVEAGHRLVLGGVVGFDRLVAMAGDPRDDECADGWNVFETTRFGRYARRLWDGLLAHEELVDR